MIGLTGALWRRFEDMWTVQHPPPMAQLLAAVPDPPVPEPAPMVLSACRVMETRRCLPDGCAGRPCARFEDDDDTRAAGLAARVQARPPLVEPISPVHHTCEPLTDSTGTTRGRCLACRAWRELAREDP